MGDTGLYFFLDLLLILLTPDDGHTTTDGHDLI
jgi:hypothetical protein